MASGWISKKIRANIYARDSYICCYCGIQTLPYSSEMQKSNALLIATLDHIVSRHEIAKQCDNDAGYSAAIKNPENLVCVCNGCNSSKKHTDLEVWCETKGYDYTMICREIARRVS